MEAEYFYDETLNGDVIRLNGKKIIMLTEASSGIQSVAPIYTSVKYLTDDIYQKPESVSYEKRNLIENSVNNVQTDVISIIDEDYQAQDSSGILGEFSIIEGPEIDRRLDAIKDNISRTHFANIIIEEPELSIFPKSQVAMVRDFLKMLNPERDMLVFTTHSPYVLYALNNYMLGWLAKDNIQDEGEEQLLEHTEAFVNPKSVSVWEIKDGEFLPVKDSKDGTIQDENGLIRGNYFDRVMKDVVSEFSAFLSYYE